MDPQRFERIAELFEGALQIAEPARLPWLDQHCADDASLRTEVLSLLKHHDESESTLGRSALDPVADLPDIIESLAAEEQGHPDRIGSYRIREVLGEGGFGIVYRAEQDHPRRDVALKILRPWMRSPKTLRRFEFEAEILGRLRHPGIAQIHEAGTAQVEGEEKPVPFLAMEYIAGPPLTAYVEAHRLSVEDRLNLFAKVCDAIQHAHQNGVIHRDLKPENILVEEGSGLSPRRLFDRDQGSGEVSDLHLLNPEPRTLNPKILDFGVARMIDSDVRLTTLSADAGRIIGTLAYMSPEQVAGDTNAIDTRADIYSAGVILFELLTGRLPYDLTGRSLPEACRIIRDQPPLRMSSCVAPVSNGGVAPVFNRWPRSGRGDLDIIVARALEKDPNRRYQTAAGLADDIRHYLAGEPILARRDSALYVFRKMMRRYRWVVGTTLFIILLLTAFSVILWRKSDENHRLALNEGEAKQQALAAKIVATRRFDQVRQLANTFLFDVHDQIVNLPGSTSARQMLVTTALQYLDALAKEAGDDLDLQLELAQAYQRVARVQSSLSSTHLGDATGALESQYRAIEMLEKLALLAPDNLRYREALGISYCQLRDVPPQVGARFGQTERTAKAIALFADLAANHPDERRYRWQLCQAYLAKWYHLIVDPDCDPRQALDELDKTRGMIESLVEDNPADFEARRSLATCHQLLGDLYGSPIVRHELSDDGKALEHYEIGLALDREGSGPNVHNRELQRGPVIFEEKIASVLQRLGRGDEALATQRRVVEQTRAMVEDDPDDALARKDLVSFLERLADYQSKADLPEEALTSFGEAIERLNILIENDPQNAGHYCQLGMLWHRVSSLHIKRGDTAGIIESTDQALKAWGADVIAGFLEPGMYASVVQGAARRLADAHLALKDTASALEAHRRAVMLIENFADLRGPEPKVRLAVAKAHIQLADALISDPINAQASADERVARSAEACAQYREILALLKGLPIESSGEDAEPLIAEVTRKLADCQ